MNDISNMTDILDIAQPSSYPFWVLWVFIGLIFLGLGTLIFFWIKKKFAPKIKNPNELFLEAMDGLMQNSNQPIKERLLLFSLSFRMWCEERFDVPALPMTVPEFKEALTRIPIFNEESSLKIGQLFDRLESFCFSSALYSHAQADSLLKEFVTIMTPYCKEQEEK